jgi:hypothetical protein
MGNMKERGRLTLICGFAVILVVIALCCWGAYATGHKKGYGNGYDKGYNEGYNAGYNVAAEDEGREKAIYEKAYEEGYNAGVAEVEVVQPSDKPWYKFW